MSHSIAQGMKQVCPQCSTTFDVEVWVIIDAVERPDLLARVQQGDIHTVICPSCACYIGCLGAPLLCYQPGTAHPLVFYPVESPEPDELVEQLRERIGEDWDDSWRVETAEEVVQANDLQRQLDAAAAEALERMGRELMLRQQLKIIMEELGDDSLDETLDWRQRLELLQAPEHVKAKAREEVRRLERQAGWMDTPEQEVGRAYLDLLFRLPWQRAATEPVCITRAQEVLDAEHHGLDEVKGRILDYLAVRRLITDTRQPILCLVGPPGVGKTSLCRSIARALQLPFLRVNLGGLHDEADIRGHRRTYIGAYPGRIIQGLRTIDTNGPICMLDEIDKTSQGTHGHPAWALLEVLDPEQNHSFIDHYLEIPYDLSNVFFIATANRIDSIPEMLLDRMEVIELSGYTPDEKCVIARRFLLPRQRELNGLEPMCLELTDAALTTIITQYTDEGGVRGLERTLATICRKVARQLLVARESGSQDPEITIDGQDIAAYLGPPLLLLDSTEGVPSRYVIEIAAENRATAHVALEELRAFYGERLQYLQRPFNDSDGFWTSQAVVALVDPCDPEPNTFSQ